MGGKKKENDDEDLKLFRLPGKTFAELSNTDIIRFSSGEGISRLNSRRDSIIVLRAEINLLEVNYNTSWMQETLVVSQDKSGISVGCTCGETDALMCIHQTAVLLEVKETKSLRVFFDTELRNQLLLEQAEKFGLQNEPDLAEFFNLEWYHGRINIISRNKGLLSLDAATRKKLDRQLTPKTFLPSTGNNKAEETFLLLGNASYAKEFYIRLYESPLSKEGRPKNPLRAKTATEEILKTEDVAAIRMYSALSRYQQDYRVSQPIAELEPEAFHDEINGLKIILANPLGLKIYEHDRKKAETVRADSVVPVSVKTTSVNLAVNVDQNGHFYEITGSVEAGNHILPFDNLDWPYRFFIRRGKELFLIDNYHVVRVLDFFRTNDYRVIIHESNFDAFRENYLSKLESKISVNYSYVKPAPQKLIESSGLNRLTEKIIYLGESEEYILITPVIRYGEVEIPVRSRRQLITPDQSGKTYSVRRNEEEESRMLLNVLRTHEQFSEQEGEDFFYLHRNAFLNEDWFLDTFDFWMSLGYQVLGFSDLKNNRFSKHKAKIVTHVNSGIDWFDAHVKVSFGDQQVRLRDVQKSVANKSRYVKLGDGTLGVLPQEWLEKFDKYFRIGDIAGDLVRVPKSNFHVVDELFKDEVLPEEVSRELSILKEKAAQFSHIPAVSVPESLNAGLREYQKDGLNWLCFLDDFGFGGCLADDMGLGKTIQVIAFILKQREKGIRNTNLVVVPTSLVFNWQQEVEKFAPDIRIFTLHGNLRSKSTAAFDDYEIVLTTYGTLVSDVSVLKTYRFNYIFLDESQAIKNPESQRYKSVRLLQAKNRIVLTGTPVENNTFDLFAQLSFAVPGLLGPQKHFRDNYAIPIDKFRDFARARELHQRISPFILRRTKKQVAQELPEKTEMILYCEMGTEQRQVYDAYKKEFQLYLENAKHDDLKDGTLHILQGLTKLRQICNSPALLNDKEFYGSESSKIEVLVEQIREKHGEHKILVFSQFVSMLELIAAELKKEAIGFSMLTGQTRNRKEVVDEFREQDRNRVFLISLKAGGTGLNLTEADYVFIVDPWWNPAVENQAIDRAYRIGQEKHVMAVRLICPGTIEEKIMQLQATKKELVNELVRTDLSASKSLGRQDILDLLRD